LRGLALAVWCWYLGTPQVDVYSSLPYTAQAPATHQKREFKTIDDIWEEIEALSHERGWSKFSEGQNLFHVVPLFADPYNLIEPWMWDMINEFNYVTRYNIPLAQSLDEADAFRLDCFTVIDNELRAVTNFKNGR
jgi:hypothetical protein